MAELDRAATAAGLRPESMLSRGLTLHTVDVHDVRVLDLRAPTALTRVGLSLDDIGDEDRTACQAVGQAAYFLDLQAVLAPSATGVGDVLVAFEPRLEAGQLVLDASEPLTFEFYTQLRA